MASRPTIKRKS
ncbi:hypothetical protein ECTW09195_2848, partial [Escherichia coli TW09195]